MNLKAAVMTFFALGEEQALETQREEMVGNFHISRIHAQLRRMKRNSNYSENVFLTAIPEQRSKVSA